MQFLPKGLKVTLYPTDMSEYTAQVYAGLFDLRARGELTVTLRRLRKSMLKVPHSVYLECSSAQLRRSSRVFIDLIDKRELREQVLGSVDIYVKRSLRVAPFRGPEGTSVIPYGLHFSARTPSITSFTRASLHWQASFRGGIAYSPVERLQAAGAAAARLIRRGSVIGKTSPRPLISIESTQREEKRPQVFFATRVYAPEEAPEAVEREVLNQRRAALIRGLRDAFGERFVGGLRPTSYAREHFGDCVYQVENNHAWHYGTGNKTLIHVNSTGLHGSTGWKFAEALAQRSCLVSDPCLDQLPSRLVPGTHYLAFDSVEGCIQQCRDLLRFPARADSLRHAGHAYYLSGVQPQALMRSVLLRSIHVASRGNN